MADMCRLVLEHAGRTGSDLAIIDFGALRLASAAFAIVRLVEHPYPELQVVAVEGYTTTESMVAALQAVF